MVRRWYVDGRRGVKWQCKHDLIWKAHVGGVVQCKHGVCGAWRQGLGGVMSGGGQDWPCLYLWQGRGSLSVCVRHVWGPFASCCPAVAKRRLPRLLKLIGSHINSQKVAKRTWRDDVLWGLNWPQALHFVRGAHLGGIEGVTSVGGTHMPQITEITSVV